MSKKIIGNPICTPFNPNKLGGASATVSVDVTANSPVPFQLGEGELAQISYTTSYTGTGDIYLKANEASASAASYTFTTSGNYTGGILTYSGGTINAVFNGWAKVQNGNLSVWGMDMRGNGTGQGRSVFVWSGIGSAESLTFNRDGFLSFKKL